LTNAEIRQWYLEQVSRIPELVRQWTQQGLSVEERARKAWRIRHDTRLQARSMMAEQSEVELVRQRDIKKYGNPNGPTFSSLVEKFREKGYEGDALYEAIIEGASRTDENINRLF
jgi:hypothetical protein